MEIRRRINRYRTQSIHYFENAQHFIEIGELEKASEFLWGSITQALKAVAASRDIRLRSHRSIQEYVEELAKALKDDSIRSAFLKAQLLHSNFYESDMTKEDVVLGAEEIKMAVTKLLGFLLEKS